ncbi:hypothetical protein QQ045_007605 [Rhodiola kirilowii]
MAEEIPLHSHPQLLRLPPTRRSLLRLAQRPTLKHHARPIERPTPLRLGMDQRHLFLIHSLFQRGKVNVCSCHVMTFEVGATLEDAKWQAPVYCFGENNDGESSQTSTPNSHKVGLTVGFLGENLLASGSGTKTARPHQERAF